MGMFWQLGQRCGLQPYGSVCRAARCGFRGSKSRLQQVCRSKHVFRLCKLRYHSCQQRDLSSYALGVEARRQAAGLSAGMLAACT